MGITASNVTLVKSAVMDDVPEGGGAPVSTVITDATSNSIFNDISELDRAGGRVNLRKTFVSIKTNDTDGYFGGNVIVADPPNDPLVSVSLFTTGQVFDTRDDASARVEAYLNAGPEWPGFLYENHITGQRSIQLFQRTNQAPPSIGRTLLLRMNEGTGTEYEQYVRVTDVTSEERTFTIPGTATDYQALIVTCSLSDALRYDFAGTPANREFLKGSGKTLTRDTVVADAASYYGVVPLASAVTTNDSSCTAESIYTQLVPSTRAETSLIDQSPASAYQYVLATAPRQVLVGGSPLSQRIKVGQENRGYNWVTLLTPLPAPGSLRVVFRALGNTYVIEDNGDGTLGGSGSSGSGTVNYSTGSVSVTLNALPDDASGVVFYWGQNTSYTDRSGQAGFRAPEYSFYLEHSGIIPASAVFTWTSGGVVKTATTNSAGVISGHAEGEVVFVTGAVWLRPTAMIDPGGQFSITYDWADVVEETKSGLTPDGAGMVSFSVAQTPVPGSVELNWFTLRETSTTGGSSSSYGSSTKSSDAKTSVTMVQQSMTRYTPLSSIVAAVSFQSQANDHQVSSTMVGSPFYSGGTTISPYVTTTQRDASSSSTYTKASSQTSKSGVTVSHILTDNGSGGFLNSMGAVSYVGKTVTVKVIQDYTETSYNQNYEQASAWESLNATGISGGGGPAPSSTQGGGGSTTGKGGDYSSFSQKEVYGSAALLVRYRTSGASAASHTENFTPPATTIDLCPYTKDIIVPGSVRFVWMGTTYDDFEGKIYRGRTDVNPGVHCGGISYSSGIVTMFDYIVSGSPTSFTLTSMFTSKGRPAIANVTFNTPAAPVKPTGIVLSVIDVNGTQITATGELDGDIVGTHTRGRINYETGLVEVQFGDYVLDSSLTAAQKAEWWYDNANIRSSDGKIWRPWPVDPESLRYNFVSYFYLPLDADILGIDPVRLPQDGRVPIFRPGRFAVLGHTGTVGPATASNGQTINAGRVRLSRWRVIGNNGAVITTGYTQDLNAGTLTVTDVTGWSQPVTFEHRIEDMAMIGDVQINGKIGFTRPITHDYPVPGSYLSTALVTGDLRARVSISFDQQTWNNVWTDAQSGSAATGTFNTTSNPIVVTNSGALTERWAIQFINSTSFNVIGEHVGVIATGNTSADCSPTNPASGTPYFTIPAAGWGLGWATGNVFRFNTVGAYYPVWVVRSIQQGPETVSNDSFTVLIRGDVDNP